jgi:hypothetical protein
MTSHHPHFCDAPQRRLQRRQHEGSLARRSHPRDAEKNTTAAQTRWAASRSLRLAWSLHSCVLVRSVVGARARAWSCSRLLSFVAFSGHRGCAGASACNPVCSLDIGKWRRRDGPTVPGDYPLLTVRPARRTKKAAAAAPQAARARATQTVVRLCPVAVAVVGLEDGDRTLTREHSDSLHTGSFPSVTVSWLSSPSVLSDSGQAVPLCKSQSL